MKIITNDNLILNKKLNRLLKIPKKFWDKNIFDNFQKYTSKELDYLEKSINRKLPKELRFFYENIWSGEILIYRYNHWYLDSLNDIKTDLCNLIYFKTWSLSRDEEWATREEQNKFYITRWIYNPNKEKFTKENLTFFWKNLLDFIDIWSNWCCWYFWVYIWDDKNLEFWLFTDYETFEYKNKSFLDWLFNYILDEYIKYNFNVNLFTLNLLRIYYKVLII